VRTHTVAVGETLYGISRQYGVTVETIRTLNQLGDAPISVGQLLQIPASGETNPEPGKLPVFHAVQPGETAYSIAKKYGISLEDLKRWNNLPDFVMRTGMRLLVSE
jgi:membrane-bound lytic murein transglycosylase D